jgi:hypothetical protein
MRGRLTTVRRWLAAGGNQILMTVDQLVSSAVSFAVLAAVVTVTSDAQFGVFRFVVLVQTAQWYIGRAVVSEPTLVSRVAATGGPERLRPPAATALCLGLLVALGSGAIAFAVHGPIRSLLLVQALASPFLAVFDQARYVGYARGRPWLSLALDGGWLLLFATVAVGLSVTGHLTMVSGYLVWALTGAVLTLVAVACTGSPLALRQVASWFADQRRLIPGFLIEALYLAGGTFATFAVAAWAAGLAEFGLFSKALIPITTLTVLFVGIGNALLVHLAGRSAGEVIRAPILVVGLAAVACAVFALVVLVAPDGLMSRLLATDWPAVRRVILILLVYVFLLATGQAAIVAAKATGRAWVGPRVRTVELICELGLVAVLGGLWGAAGAAGGMAMAWAVGAAYAWIALTRHARRRSDRQTRDPVGSAV